MPSLATLPAVIAILQGKESVHTVGIEPKQFERLYSVAHKMVNNGYVAILSNGKYTVSKHSAKWQRRIR